jgi:K+ transporter
LTEIAALIFSPMVAKWFVTMLAPGLAVILHFEIVTEADDKRSRAFTAAIEQRATGLSDCPQRL